MQESTICWKENILYIADRTRDSTTEFSYVEIVSDTHDQLGWNRFVGKLGNYLSILFKGSKEME